MLLDFYTRSFFNKISEYVLRTEKTTYYKKRRRLSTRKGWPNQVYQVYQLYKTNEKNYKLPTVVRKTVSTFTGRSPREML